MKTFANSKQRALVSVAVVFGFLAAACGGSPGPTAVETESDGTSVFAVSGAATPGGGSSCPADHDFVVTTDAELRTALGAAAPGDVIGIEGLIELEDLILVATPDLTLTCASPGSGLRRVADNPFALRLMVVLVSPRVALTQLVLESPNVGVTVFGLNTKALGGPFDARDLLIAENEFLCGVGQCVFLAGVPGSKIADNRFLAESSFSGIHLQGVRDRSVDPPELVSPIDGTEILRNTVATTNRSPGNTLGGIRVRDGRDVLVVGNLVTGPWAAGIALTEITAGRIESNRLEDAYLFGVSTFNAIEPIALRNSVFLRNRVSNVGDGAVMLTNACDNVFLGNDLEEGTVATVVLTELTGGNNVFGPVASALDDGSLDCDGDGVADPNTVPAAGLVSGGAEVGETMQATMPEVMGITAR